MELTKRKIYIVDDDEMLSSMLYDYLSKNSDLEIRNFQTGEECLENLTPPPDIVILDFNLNSIDINARNGLEILKEIKKINPNILVIMYSSQEQYGSVKSQIGENAIEYVIKDQSAFSKIDSLINNFKPKKVEEKRHIDVLIIEDDEFISMVYRDQLTDVKNIHFELDFYTHLYEGLDALKEKKYDVLLLDLNLPDSDYVNTIEKIPSISYQLPIVIMTSANDELLALKTMNKGGQDYLVKSKLDRTLFIRSVLYSIERHRLRRELQEEKEKSDSLLRNILPQSIAEELKAKGSIKARYYDEVSVMFIDFANFTQSASKMSSEELVNELHTYFSEFDMITEKFGLEKIKTIGDAYMCAGGIPEKSDTHLKDMVNAGFEIIQMIEERYLKRSSNNLPFWRARIGLHVGPAVAGVVGSRKFTYDIWGDTVNTAARIESGSEIGKINISETVFQEIKDEPEFSFENRGKMEAKGKGLIDMYFVSQNESAQ